MVNQEKKGLDLNQVEDLDQVDLRQIPLRRNPKVITMKI